MTAKSSMVDVTPADLELKRCVFRLMAPKHIDRPGRKQDAGKDATDDAALDQLGLALLESDAVEEDLDDGGEEGVDGGAEAHGRLGRDGGDGLADKVGQRDDGEQGRRRTGRPGT